MSRRILVIDGHPDADPQRFVHALARAYADGADERGHATRLISIAEIDFNILRTASQFGMPPDQQCILQAQADLKWADHIVIVFPLWQGAMPALLKAFLEQVSRGGLVAEANRRGWTPKFKGKSARLIVTMGMPGPIYRLMFGAHGVEALKRSILNFAGVSPVRETFFGSIGDAPRAKQELRLAWVREFGRRAI